MPSWMRLIVRFERDLNVIEPGLGERVHIRVVAQTAAIGQQAGDQAQRLGVCD